MMHFMLLLNRREKNEEGNLKLYKSVQDSISGLLGDSFTDSSNSHGWLWGTPQSRGDVAEHRLDIQEAPTRRLVANSIK